ncbi:MAG: aminoacetone oxidase family FAD-binding enzyme [Clostridiales bacterium]|nr:aminoacetone oxidase family FAD-binding enzyme [Clostridiales bacterium]
MKADLKKYNTVIIGGGASGLMCACRLAYNGISDIAVLERNPKAGKKLLMTGNGRCNLTNDDLDVSLYNTDNREVLENLISKYPVSVTKVFFERVLNIALVSKNGLVYPRTLKGITVLEAMLYYLKDHGVEIITDMEVSNISQGFVINDSINADNVVIAGGGASYPKTGSDGSSYKLISAFSGKDDMVPVYPSLVQLNIRESDIRKLSGERINCKVTLVIDRQEVASETGEMLFTDYGVSGICIMQLSGIFNRYRKAGIKTVSVVVDMFPDMNEEDLRSEVERRGGSLKGLLLSEISDVVLSRNGDVVKNLKSFELTITGTRDLDSAQVTGGGLKLSALTEGMMLKDLPGLYVTGEAVNVDGPCGGYNLQWAWSSAFSCADDIAGRSL